MNLNRDAAREMLNLAKEKVKMSDPHTGPCAIALIGIGYAVLEVADSVRDRTWEITRSLKP